MRMFGIVLQLKISEIVEIFKIKFRIFQKEIFHWSRKQGNN